MRNSKGELIVVEQVATAATELAATANDVTTNAHKAKLVATETQSIIKSSFLTIEQPP